VKLTLQHADGAPMLRGEAAARFGCTPLQALQICAHTERIVQIE
jgi:hypothetical protein